MTYSTPDGVYWFVKTDDGQYLQFDFGRNAFSLGARGSSACHTSLENALKYVHAAEDSGIAEPFSIVREAL